MTDDMSPEERNPGFGITRTLSLRCVLHLALIAELSRVGLPQARASHLALTFSNRIDPSTDGRSGCRPKLFRVLYPLGGGNPVARVESPETARDNVPGSDDPGCIAMVTIDLEAMSKRVRTALGIP